MPDTVTPYVSRSPRDLITAEDWNQMQILVKGDIKTQVERAIDEIQTVPKAGDAGKLDGKSRAELLKEILDAVLQAVNQRTGYMRIFKRLTKEQESIVKHELKDFPVADVYQLEWFDVICSEDDIKEKHKVLFFLYHSSEKRIRTKTENGTEEAEIEPSGPGAYKIPFSKLLELYKVEYDDDSSLGDLESEFWDAFFKDPNDEFDDDHYCHSPWFDRCCGEKRTVSDLKKRGDWDEVWLQMRPVKTINSGMSADGVSERFPADVRIRQYDFDTLGARVLQSHDFEGANDETSDIPSHLVNEMPVLILLKV